MIYRINGCSIDTDAYELRRDGRAVPVEPQVFDLLVFLLERKDRVVTKEEIADGIWHGRIVSDAALSSRIKSVRQAIGDSGASQKLIRTIRRRGFRVVGDVGLDAHPPGGRDKGLAAQPSSSDIAGIDKDDPGRQPYGRAIPPAAPRAGQGRGRSLRTAVIAASVAAPLAMTAVGWQWLDRRLDVPSPFAAAALGMPAGPRIAVLQFDNYSEDSPSSFLARAIADEIATHLTRFSELRVAAGAAASLNDVNAARSPDVGRLLDADFVVRGSLQQSNERIRVTAQLLAATDGKMLWAETYERPLTPADMMAVQEDIASKVAAAVGSISGGVIAREALGQGRGKPPRDLSAYECVARANEVMNSGFSAATHLAARTCLEQAVRHEPDYAAAWAMLAWVHSLEFAYDYNKRPESDPRERALAAARRAVDLAPANPMARFAMARAAQFMGDFHLLHAEAAAALELNPHDPFLLGNLGNWLAFSGRWDEGVAMVRKAIALNPKVYPRWWHAAIGKDRYRKGEFLQALAEFKTMNLPNWWWNQVELAYTYGQLGDADNARAATAKLLELYPGFDLETAVMEHRKFGFEPSYIDLAIEGLRKAGVPERASLAAKP
jgi:TolB-like protein/DNA-binding winged helix-turn-helix (wHTH) protein/Tfp pilus assembly protein PilF